jgi:hypothetical protein
MVNRRNLLLGPLLECPLTPVPDQFRVQELPGNAGRRMLNAISVSRFRFELTPDCLTRPDHPQSKLHFAPETLEIRTEVSVAFLSFDDQVVAARKDRTESDGQYREVGHQTIRYGAVLESAFSSPKGTMNDER